MIETSTKIEGLSDLHQQLEKLVDLATEKKKTKQAAMFAIKPILDEVKLKAPVADKAYYRYYRGSQRQRRRGNAQNSRKLVTPGNLKNSIKRRSVELEKSVGAAVYVGTSRWLFNKRYYPYYWRFLEYGTPHILAVPFLRPAFELKKYIALHRFKDRYKKYIDAIVQRKSLESIDVGE